MKEESYGEFYAVIFGFFVFLMIIVPSDPKPFSEEFYKDIQGYQIDTILAKNGDIYMHVLFPGIESEEELISYLERAESVSFAYYAQVIDNRIKANHEPKFAIMAAEEISNFGLRLDE